MLKRQANNTANLSNKTKHRKLSNTSNDKIKNKKKKNNNAEEEELCPICMEPLNDGQPLKSCHTGEGEHPHTFHARCLDHWLRQRDNDNNSCPLDRMKCLTDAQYNEEFRENAPPAQIAVQAAQTAAAAQADVIAQAVAAGIPTEAEDLLEPREQLPIGFADDWNDAHPNGPWWNEARCGYCDNFQWFLTYQGENTNQAAFDDGGWDSWGGELICPECQEEMTMCEDCGERFVRDEQEYALRDPYTGDDYCEECFRRRYENDNDIDNVDTFIRNVRDGVYQGHNPQPLPGVINNGFTSAQQYELNGGRRRRKRKQRKTRKSKKQKKTCKKKRKTRRKRKRRRR